MRRLVLVELAVPPLLVAAAAVTRCMSEDPPRRRRIGDILFESAVQFLLSVLLDCWPLLAYAAYEMGHLSRA